jgi:transposase-like protein
VLSEVPKAKVKSVATMLKAIHAQEDRAAACRKTEEVVEKLAGVVREGAEATLAYMAFPQEHWRQIRTNNPPERIMREIRRRTRVVGAFPDGGSALLWVAARRHHIAGTRWGAKRCLDMDRLRQQEQEERIEAVGAFA